VPLSEQYAVSEVDGMATAIQDCRVHSGSGAIRFTSEAAGKSQVQMPLLSPVNGGALYARWYAFLPSGLSMSQYLIMLELWPGDWAQRVTVEGVGDDRLEVYQGTTGATLVSAAGTFPRDRWVCLELGLELSATAGAASLSADGVQLVAQSSLANLPSSPIDEVVLSAVPYTDAVGVDLTLDDLVVGTEPIGCE